MNKIKADCSTKLFTFSGEKVLPNSNTKWSGESRLYSTLPVNIYNKTIIIVKVIN